MKKLFAGVSSTFASSLFFVQSAFAELDPPPDIDGLSGGSGTQGIKDAIVKVLETVLDFILIVAVVFVVVAGIRLIVSGGDEGEKDKAKTTILYVIIGIVVVLLARVIVTFAGSLIV